MREESVNTPGPRRHPDLRRKVLQGGAYLVARKGIGVAINASCLVVLLALIGPSEYGLFMAAVSFNIVLLNIAKSGIHVYLVRRPDPLDVRELHQAFTILLGTGLLIVATAMLALPLVAAWVQLDGFRAVATGLFAGLPLALATVLPTVRLERALDYRRISQIDVVAQLIYQAVTLTLAFLGLGALAMVSGWWAQFIFSTIVLYKVAQYRPRLVWDSALARSMVSYGISFSASRWLIKARGLANPLIVGPLLGPAAVGYVALSYRLCELLCFAREAAERISISAIARVQHERSRLLRGLEQGIQLQILGTGPVLVLFTLVAAIVLPLVPDERAVSWIPVLQIFPLIAFAYLASGIFTLQVSALHVLGENRAVGVFGAINLLVLMALGWILIPRVGLLGFGLAEVGSVLTYALIQRRATALFGRVRFGLALGWAAALGLLLLWQTLGWFSLTGIILAALSPRTRVTLAEYMRELSGAMRAYMERRRSGTADSVRTDDVHDVEETGTTAARDVRNGLSEQGAPEFTTEELAGRRLKVLISAYACCPGRGSEPGIGWNTAREMARYHDVWVITRTADARGSQQGPIEADMAREPVPNLRVVYFDLPRWMVRTLNKQVRYYLWQLASYVVLRRLHARIGFDLTHHVSWVRCYTPSALALLPVPFLWGPVGGGDVIPRSFLGGLGPEARRAERARRVAQALTRLDPLVRLTARRSTLALANSQETSERIAGIGARRIRLFGESGLDPWVSKFSSDRVLPAQPCFASMTRLVHWKGVHLGLEAFARLDYRQAVFRVIGSGPEKANLVHLAQRLGIAGRVIFEEQLARAAWMDRLRQCDALVHPCIYNSGGAISLEAMALGVPVICLDRGGIREQVPVNAGFRLAADDPDTAVAALAAAMQRIIEDRSCGLLAGKRAREHVLQHFSWDVRGRMLRQFYLQAVGESPSAAVARAAAAGSTPTGTLVQQSLTVRG